MEEVQVIPGTTVESDDFQQFLKQHCTKIDNSEILDSKFDAKTPHFSYNGFVIPEFLLKGYFASFKVKFYNEDTMLTSFPKTGTTWAQELVFMVINDGDESVANSINLEERFPYVELVAEAESDVLNSTPPPRLFKSHMPYSLLPGINSSNYKIVYICRNAKDTVVSLYHFFRMNNLFKFTGTLSDLVNIFVNDLAPYSPYGKHVLEFWNRSKIDKNVLFLQYEDLQQDIKGNIKRMAEFFGKNLSEEVCEKIAHRCSFAQMSVHPTSNLTYYDGNILDFTKSKFLRKGVVGDWKNHFSDEDNRKMDNWIQTNFGNSDIKFIYE
ncbi:hypothetical protein CHUAL_003031 [Chamberlinius hualienensis]